MKTYSITSNQGIEFGSFTAESPIDALDALARDAGYANHAASCEVTGSNEDDWTTEREVFQRGRVGLLVVRVAD